MKERLGGFDRFRLPAALLVIAVHTGPLLSVSVPANDLITDIWGRIAVPFFFAVSGWFLVPRLEREGLSALLPFLKKTLGLYALAALLYLPLNFYNGALARPGTELLRESPPETDFSGYCVEGDTSLTELSPALAEGINTYYQERGALYDIQAEVEKAYQAYQKSEAPERFSSFWVRQQTGWAATAPGVYYFRTALTLPVREQEITEHWFTDAFDKETGEHIPNRDLFSVGQAEAAEAVVAGTEAIGQEAQAMREQFQWSYLNFGEDSLSVWYPAGTLPGREYPSGWGLDYRDLKDVLHLWAVPEAPEP